MEAIERVGAVPLEGGTDFTVWAPEAERVEVVIRTPGGSTAHALEAAGGGWHRGRAPGARPGDRYRLRLDGGGEVPDPLSRSQPDGVHGDSEIVDVASFPWNDDAWSGIGLDDLVIYEVHTGTATREGTFDALIPRLPELVDLGVTALELMPVAAFPGARNWGYDGVYPFAPAHPYGGARGLQRLVNAAHDAGLAVILDVVYNHFGPDGNYFPAVTGDRIFTDRHHTPWGAAVNYDDAGAAGVRAIVLANVAEWVRDYHIDGLRLDATHAIMDTSKPHILAEITRSAREATTRNVVVIAEDERNERHLVLPPPDGMGLDAVWADDFHHSMRRLLAGDSDGYFAAYRGTVEELSRTIRRGWLYEGDHYEPTGTARGTPAAGLPPPCFVHCLQNHDQVGNRAMGERLHHQVETDAYRAASALLLMSPYTPLLWMGQEWAATSPFLYFTDHPEELGRLVTRGRREEFRQFAEFADPELRARIPDPQAETTFERSRLDWTERGREPHAGVLRLYRELIRLRRRHPALQARSLDAWDVTALSDGALALRRRGPGEDLLLVANLRGALETQLGRGVTAPVTGHWQVVLSTNEERFGGRGDPAGPGREGRLALAGPGAVLLRS
ncbi:MAG TPA: malto-oligosyltrehalose trehalohydrolase [Longimicrobiales bacterium]|nr:malto-oligosyltrehalose trehalohydrolase [Longimicrobiales bacterium]